MATYAEKLLDPRWQQKRLRILDRDKFTCQLCQDQDTTLHIHHFFYLKDYEPWDYDDKDLITYCKHCHAITECIKEEKSIQSILSVTKYRSTEHKEARICVLVNNIQNENFCCIFRYDENDNSLEFAISLPDYIISRISFEINIQKEKYNNA